MAAKVLQLVSSGFFGTPQRVHDPAQAAILLGLENLRALVQAEALVPWHNEADRDSLELFADHSRTVAAAARAIALLETADPRCGDEAFLAGLLHDVGALVLAQESPHRYRELLAACRQIAAADVENRTEVLQRHACRDRRLLDGPVGAGRSDRGRDHVSPLPVAGAADGVHYVDGRSCGRGADRGRRTGRVPAAASGRYRIPQPDRLCRPRRCVARSVPVGRPGRSMSMSERILCVDDDPNVLQAYQRALRKQFHIEPAFGGEEALQAVVEQGPYAVVVSDMRMPGMNGVELLAKVSEIAPDTVRMMLTGNADQETALEAVNQGHIFRFMTKPCPPEMFAKALEAGLAQYRLITAERELALQDAQRQREGVDRRAGLVNPAAFGRAARVRRLVHELCARRHVSAAWQVEIAAMLSQIGCVAVPEETLAKVYRGEPLTRAESEAFAAHPATGYELLKHIPRLEEVAEIVAYQEKRFDGQGYPADNRCGAAIPLGSRILKVALDFDTLLAGGASEDMAMAEINDRGEWYDPDVVAALREALAIERVHVVRRLRVPDLIDGAILAEDVRVDPRHAPVRQGAGGDTLAACAVEELPGQRRRAGADQGLSLAGIGRTRFRAGGRLAGVKQPWPKRRPSACCTWKTTPRWRGSCGTSSSAPATPSTWPPTARRDWPCSMLPSTTRWSSTTRCPAAVGWKSSARWPRPATCPRRLWSRPATTQRLPWRP